MKTINPVFIHLVGKLQEMQDEGTEHTEEGLQLFQEMMGYAPDEFKDAAVARMIEAGLLPERPDGYTEDGQPMYDGAAMARRMGLTLEEIPESIRARMCQGTVHRAQ